MRNIIIVALITIFFSGCSFKSRVYLKPNTNLTTLGLVELQNNNYVYLKPNTKITFSNMQLLTPSSFPQNHWNVASITVYNGIGFSRSIQNIMRENISIQVAYLHSQNSRRLLVKKTNHEYEKIVKSEWGRPTDWELMVNREIGINYVKNYIDYVGGLKCTTYVEGSSFIPGIGNKRYGTDCLYYDKEGKDKWFLIGYTLQTLLSSEEFKAFNNPEDLVRQKNKLIEIQFKKDMKEIFDSIVILDMDVKKMEEEELLYDRKYDINNENKAVDISMECKLLDIESEIWEYKCVGRETKEVVMCTLIFVPEDHDRWECK